MVSDESSSKRYLSVKEVQQWAQQEIADAAKAHALRVKHLVELARAYGAGEISPKEADALHSLYYDRWGDALPSISARECITDEQILRSLDEAAERRKVANRARTQGRYL